MYARIANPQDAYLFWEDPTRDAYAAFHDDDGGAGD